VEKTKSQWVAQSGPDGDEVVTLAISKSVGDQTETSQLCVGEKLVSLRQVIKRPASLGTKNFVLPVSTDGSGYVSHVVVQPFRVPSADPAGQHPVRLYDALAMIAPYYRFSRGSMRVRGTMTTGSGPDSQGTVVATCAPASENGILSISNAEFSYWHSDYLPQTGNGEFNYLVPPYQLTPFSPLNYAQSTTGPLTYNWTAQNAVHMTGVDWQANDTLVTRLTRQPADDYELLRFIGPPLFVIPL
jgi:hypothetical protein